MVPTIDTSAGTMCLVPHRSLGSCGGGRLLPTDTEVNLGCHDGKYLTALPGQVLLILV